MELTGQIKRRVLLFSLAVLILPVMAFPAQFGAQLARVSLTNILYELVYYGLVAFLFRRQTSLFKLMQAAGLCLVYRLTLGAGFSLFIAGLYSMNLGVAMSLGLSGYLPTILIQAALAPWILKPVIDGLYPPEARERTLDRSREINTATNPAVQTGHTSIAVSRDGGVRTENSAYLPKSAEPSSESEAVFGTADTEKASSKTNQDQNGFERAVRYIGEHGAVHLAAVVDGEGLLLANFCRGGVEPEDWAPLALVATESSNDVLRRVQLEDLERVDFHLKDHRLVVARTEGYCLMVMSERHDDDLLNIRINQGLEMINKFVAMRYGDKLNTNAERTHVSSAQ